MPTTLYEAVWIYLVYAFLGWCCEVIFAAACHGKFVNRGFLNGPVCPIYGAGVLLIIVCLTPLKGSFIALFIGSVALTSALEFATGFVMDRFFGDKWWDYSGQPFNIMGYVCLRFSLIWGLACVLVMNTVQPIVMRFISLMSGAVGHILFFVFIAALLCDSAATLAETIKMKKRLALMTEIGARLHELGDRLGEPLATKTLDVREKLQEGKDELDEKRADSRRELEELREKYRALTERGSYIQKRLLTAFPQLSNGRHSESIERVKAYWRARKSDKK